MVTHLRKNETILISNGGKMSRLFYALVLVGFLFTVPCFAQTKEVESNYSKFEKIATPQAVKKVEKAYKYVPKINQGFLVTPHSVRPHMSITLFEKKGYSFDGVISYQTLGFSLNKILVSIIDIKMGPFVGYSFDKDMAYHKWYGGVCFSLVKF